MLTDNLQLCVGESLEKEVGIDVCVTELPPVVVVPGGVGSCVHRTTHICFNWQRVDIA